MSGFDISGRDAGQGLINPFEQDAAEDFAPPRRSVAAAAVDRHIRSPSAGRT
jgi:hypothetical protein